jgi:hypothetical protein
MPAQTNSASWDYNPAHSITLTATFTLDKNDPNNAVDAATITISLTI